MKESIYQKQMRQLLKNDGEIFFYSLPQPEDKKLLTVIELNKQALEGKLIL